MRPRVQGLTGLCVSAACVAGVVWWALGQQSPRLPSSSELDLVVAAIAIDLSVNLVRGWRWHTILRLAGIRHDPVDAYALTAVGAMGNNVLPARGGEVLRVLLLSGRTPAGPIEIFGTVITEKILDLALLVVLFAAFTWANVAGAPVGEAPGSVGIAVLALAIAAGIVLRRARRGGRFDRLAALLKPMLPSLRILLGRPSFPLVGGTAAIWLLEGVVFMFVGRSLGIDLDYAGAAFLVVLTSLALMIPAAPGFIGTFDATLLFGLSALHVHHGAALSFVLLTRFVLFVPITVIGCVLLLVRYNGIGALRVGMAGLFDRPAPDRASRNVRSTQSSRPAAMLRRGPGAYPGTETGEGN